MKYAVVMLVVLLGIWLWRKNRVADGDARHDSSPKSPQNTSKNASPQIMLSCAVCGVHLPQSDAFLGKRGSYCSAKHQQQKER